MDKELCFYLDKKSLFLDKTLVSFNDTPIFFVCCDVDNNYYIVLCTSIEDLEYIIVETSLKKVYEMLTQRVDMRELFLAANHFWRVKAGLSTEEDETQLLAREQLDLDVLPLSGAKYEAINVDDIAYIERVTSEFLDKDKFVAIETPRDVESVFSNIYVDIASDFVQQFTQYIDFSPLSERLFSGIKKAFKYSSKEEYNNLSYADYMESWKQVPVVNSFEGKVTVTPDDRLSDAA